MKVTAKKPALKLSFLEKIHPLNLDTEKQKFLFDPGYNPKFEYHEHIPPEELLRHGAVSNKYLEAAVAILDAVIEEYGTESKYLREEQGAELDREHSVEIIEEFLKQNRLENIVTLSFSSHFSARTALKRVGSNFVLQIRTPVQYREKSLRGMLNHEIGTHLFRWLNEMEQPWFQNRKEFGLHQDYLVAEEGLASINNRLIQDKPYLWSQALNYYLVYEGAQSSFAELNQKLKKYVDDPERRWRYCLKVKRGVEDTSMPLVFTKSQIYFLGSLQVLAWFLQHDYLVDQLYLGKISLRDLPIAKQKSTHPPVLPAFLHARQSFIDKIDEMITLNKLRRVLE